MKLHSCHYSVLILLISLLGSGCMGRTPQSHFYTLTPLKGEREARQYSALNDNIFIGVESLKFPDEVDRPAIVTRSAPNRLVVDEFHRWAGSLEKNFTRVTAENLAFLLKTDRVMTRPWELDYRPNVRISLDIHEFGGYLGEYALLNVTWSISLKNNEIPVIVRRTVVKEPVTDQSYDSFVAAQSRAVFTLCREIAGSVLANASRKQLSSRH